MMTSEQLTHIREVMAEWTVDEAAAALGMPPSQVRMIEAHPETAPADFEEKFYRAVDARIRVLARR